MTTSTEVSVRGLGKRFGAVEAVRDLTFDVPAGRVTGFVSAPGLSRPTRQSCITFVNRRWVAAPALQQALEGAYRPLLPPGRHPIVVLFVEVPPGAVDVNVHPSKAEVKLLWEADLAAFTDEELVALAKKHNCRYIVVDRTRSSRRIGLPSVYPLFYEQNPAFEVFRVP